MVRIGQLCLFNFSGLKWPEHEVDHLYLVPSLQMSGNVPLLCLHILTAQIGQCCLFQFFLPINFSHNFAKDLWVVLCNFLGIPLFLCLSAKIIPTKFMYEQYKHIWTLPTCTGVWTLTYFVNAQIVLYCKTATYIPKRHGNPSNINTLSLNKLTTEYLLSTKQYSECNLTCIIQVILHKVSKLQDITESLHVNNATTNKCPTVNCYTTVSTLRHKHGCKQEFYNMHGLS
jgi:hypothetical protein